MEFTPEMRLQVLCRPGANDNRDLIRDIPRLDWPAILKSANRHGTMPLLVSYFLPSSRNVPVRSDLPIFAVNALREYRERCLVRTLTQTAALAELQREFDRAGLRILSWKGPSVGVMLYGAATLRESIDLDFLFLKEDIQQVLRIARQLGYELLGNADSESKYLYTLTIQREFTFGRRTDHLVLEFHLQTLPSRFTLWQDAQADIERASMVCRLAGVDVLMQSPEDLLVGLCAHATKHNWDRLKWSCDVAQFLSIYGDKINWAQFLAGLRKSRKDSVVLLGLILTANLFDLQLSSVVLEAAQQKADVVYLANEVAAHIMSGSTRLLDLRHRQAIIALLCPRLRDRVAYILLPIVELNYEDLYIPIHRRMFFFMNYFFRAFRLLRKYGPHRLATKTVSSVRSVH